MYKSSLICCFFLLLLFIFYYCYLSVWAGVCVWVCAQGLKWPISSLLHTPYYCTVSTIIYNIPSITMININSVLRMSKVLILCWYFVFKMILPQLIKTHSNISSVLKFLNRSTIRTIYDWLTGRQFPPHSNISSYNMKNYKYWLYWCTCIISN